MPLARPAPRLAAPSPSSSRFGVDLVVVLARRRSWPRRGPRRSRPARRRRRSPRGRGSRRRARRGRRRPAARCRSCRRCRRRPGRAARRRATPSAPRRASPARPGANRRRPSTRASEPSADRERRGVRVAQLRRAGPRAARRSRPSPLSTPNSFGSWPTMIVSARPTMKPLSTGSEMKSARKPRRSSPATSAAMPVTIASAAVSVTYSGWPGWHVRHGGGRQRGGRRHRPDDQVARAAEQRVEQQRGRRGVEADDRRDAGDRRVGQRLGDEHRPHRQARRPGRRAATRRGSRGATGTSRATMAAAPGDVPSPGTGDPPHPRGRMLAAMTQVGDRARARHRGACRRRARDRARRGEHARAARLGARCSGSPSPGSRSTSSRRA